LPLIKEENINNSIIVGIWHCTESLGELEAEFNLPLIDQNEIDNTKMHKRKIEKTITRALSKYLLEKHFSQTYKGLQKLETGKPILVDVKLEMSVSHCENYLAVLITNLDKAGIDIQNTNEKIKAVAARIFSVQELAQINEDKNLLARAWSAKEAMFKFYEKGKINFKRDLHLKNISDSENFYGILTCNNQNIEVDFRVIEIGKSYQLVYCYDK
jgi:4'-phosphopantetheinyl transferase